MSKPNFFADVEALNLLLGMEFEDGLPEIDLTLDLIDLPIWFGFHSDETTQTLKAYAQHELYNKDESMAIERGSLVLDRESGNATVKATKALGENMGAFFAACRNLSFFAHTHDLGPLYRDLDPNEAGLLLFAEDGELRWKVVSGKERPELTVETLFGGITKARPYMEDFWERSERDAMDEASLIEAAEAGDEEAMETLAGAYLNGDEDRDMAQDFKKAFHWWQKLAEAGNAVGMFNVGLHYAKGCGVERDFGKAAEWMERSAAAGDEDAPAAAEKYRALAADTEKAGSGDAKAMAALAEAYMAMGGSLEQAGPGNDYAESLKWAQKAVDAGCGDGYWPLALAYEHGRGVDKNPDIAIEYYEQGAELGNAACQHSLGCYYIRGDYLKKDNKKAFELFRESAAQGYGLAMKDLGRCYQFGTGCMGNMKTALEWYTKASEVLDDPELDQRVMAFQSLANVDPNWGEDYPGEDDLEEDEEDDFPDGVFDASEIMKKNLAAAGKDASDEALANMSVDEAYAAFFGNFDDEDE